MESHDLLGNTSIPLPFGLTPQTLDVGFCVAGKEEGPSHSLDYQGYDTMDAEHMWELGLVTENPDNKLRPHNDRLKVGLVVNESFEDYAAQPSSSRQLEVLGRFIGDCIQTELAVLDESIERVTDVRSANRRRGSQYGAGTVALGIATAVSFRLNAPDVVPIIGVVGTVASAIPALTKQQDVSFNSYIVRQNTERRDRISSIADGIYGNGIVLEIE